MKPDVYLPAQIDVERYSAYLDSPQRLFWLITILVGVSILTGILLDIYFGY